MAMDDDEKEQFYGCGFQRFLAIGLLSPFIVFISFMGIILMLLLLPALLCFPQSKTLQTTFNTISQKMVKLPRTAFQWAT